MPCPGFSSPNRFAISILSTVVFAIQTFVALGCVTLFSRICPDGVGSAVLLLNVYSNGPDVDPAGCAHARTGPVVTVRTCPTSVPAGIGGNQQSDAVFTRVTCVSLMLLVSNPDGATGNRAWAIVPVSFVAAMSLIFASVTASALIFAVGTPFGAAANFDP